MHFISTVMTGRGTHATDNQRKYRKKQIDSGAYCCYCNVKLTHDNGTLEHKIPAIIVRASIGAIPNRMSNISLACNKCNVERSIITSKIGDIWKSKNIAAIKTASTYLCDLIRKKATNENN